MSYTPLLDTIFAGNVRVPTATPGDSDTTVANTAFVAAAISAAVTIDTLDELTDVNTTGVVDGSLLRFEGTGSTWEDTVSLLYSDAGQLQATTTGAAGGILLGGDVQWYRDAANVMRTPDALTVDGVSTLTGLATLTAGATTATGNYTTTGSGGFVASGSGAVSTASGNISTTSGNLVVTAGTALIGGKLTTDAGVNVATVAKTAAYTVDLATDYIILCDTTGGAFTITLPASHTAGDTVIVKDSGGAGAANPITIDPSDTDTIDGAATFTTLTNYQSATLVSDGTNWFSV